MISHLSSNNSAPIPKRHKTPERSENEIKSEPEKPEKLNLDQSIKTEDDLTFNQQELNDSNDVIECCSPKKLEVVESPCGSNDDSCTAKSSEIKEDDVFEDKIPLNVDSPKSTDSQNRESDHEDDENSNISISVHRKGQLVESWHCKTCNCIFLDQVNGH